MRISAVLQVCIIALDSAYKEIILLGKNRVNFIILMKNQKVFSQFEKCNKQTKWQNGKFGEFYSGKKPDCTQKPTKAFF